MNTTTTSSSTTCSDERNASELIQLRTETKELRKENDAKLRPLKREIDELKHFRGERNRTKQLFDELVLLRTRYSHVLQDNEELRTTKTDDKISQEPTAAAAAGIDIDVDMDISKRTDVPQDILLLVQLLRRDLGNCRTRIQSLDAIINKLPTTATPTTAAAAATATTAITTTTTTTTAPSRNQQQPAPKQKQPAAAHTTPPPQKRKQPPPNTTPPPATTTTTTSPQPNATTTKKKKTKKNATSSSAASPSSRSRSKSPVVYKKTRKTWNERIAELKHFVAGHGHARVPTTYEDGSLGLWLRSVRSNYRMLKSGDPKQTAVNDSVKLDEKRIIILDDLGVEWDVASAIKSWEERIEQLKAYKAEHGDLKIQKRHPVLGNFINDLRKKYVRNKLDPEKVKQVTECKCILYYIQYTSMSSIYFWENVVLTISLLINTKKHKTTITQWDTSGTPKKYAICHGTNAWKSVVNTDAVTVI
jgi:outer membrane biosynthesis protein TonB